MESKITKIASYHDLVSTLRVLPRGGCCWHIVVEDGNLRKHHIEWCAEYAERQEVDDPGAHATCLELARLLRCPGATITKLRKAIQYAHTH